MIQLNSIKNNRFGLTKQSRCPCRSGKTYVSCCVLGKPTNPKEFHKIYSSILPHTYEEFKPNLSYKDEILPRFKSMQDGMKLMQEHGATIDENGYVKAEKLDNINFVQNQTFIDGIVTDTQYGPMLYPELADGFMLGNDLRRGKEAFFWHGTTVNELPRILSEGLKLDKESHYKYEVDMKPLFGIYLTLGLAPYYAMLKISRIETRLPVDGVILKIRIKDTSRLIADEDVSLKTNVHNRIQRWKTDPVMKEKAEIVERNYQKDEKTGFYFPQISKWPSELRYDTVASSSLRKLGSVRCIDNIPPEEIVEAYTFEGKMCMGCTANLDPSLAVERILSPKEFVAAKHQEMLYHNMVRKQGKPGSSKDVYRFIKNADAKQLSEEEIEIMKSDYKCMRDAEMKAVAVNARAILNKRLLVPKLDEFGNIYFIDND